MDSSTDSSPSTSDRGVFRTPFDVARRRRITMCWSKTTISSTTTTERSTVNSYRPLNPVNSNFTTPSTIRSPLPNSSKPIRNVTTPSLTSNSKTSTYHADKNAVIAIVEGRGQARGEIGIAFMNLNLSTLILCQFCDTQTYAKVVTKINIFRPAEILLPTTLCEGNGSQLYTQLQKLVPSSTIIPIQRRIFNDAQGLTKIQSLVSAKYSTVVRLLTQKYYCIAAAAALLKYAELLHHIVFAPKSMKIEFQVSEKSCLVDSETARHLELLQNNLNPNSTQSLFGILNNCRTPIGSRLLRMNILQPPCDIHVINQRLDCLEVLVNNTELICELQKSLSQLPVDLEHVLATLIQIPKVENERILEQRINFIIALKHTLQVLPAFVSNLENVEHNYFKKAREVFSADGYAELLKQIMTILHEEAAIQKGSSNMKRQRCFAVRPGVNGLLDVARTAYCELIDTMNKYVFELGQEHKLSLRLSENRSRGFYIQHSVSGGVDITGTLPPFFLQVRKHGHVLSFTTEALLSFDQRSSEITIEIQKMSNAVVLDLIATIRGEIDSLYTVCESVANLDLLCSLANYSLIQGSQGSQPKFSKDITSISSGRHPILDSIATCPVVCNNTYFSKDTNFMLVTGPNMSGKTTYLKQVAILQIIAQLGCFVPADSATFRLADSIFARIGTGDNLESNASTFSLEMSEMDYILKNVTDTSLVIIDELGRATSIEEGTSLSFAIAEALLKTKAFVIFATHYLFLTKLESMYLNVINYTMETIDKGVENTSNETVRNFQLSKVENTHKIKRGVTDIEQYGLKLASTSSFPPGIIAEASRISDTIQQQRKTSSADGNVASGTKPSKRSLHILAQQLILASQTMKNEDPEKLRDYLKKLRQDFLENNI